jgi:hypothetical protein
MSTAAVNVRGFTALLPAGVEMLLASSLEDQAAEDLARIMWVRGYIRAELSRLYEAEPTPHLVVEVSKALVTKLRTLRELTKSSTGDRAALGHDPDALIGAELDTLRGLVEPGAAGAADWVWYGALRPWQAWVSAVLAARPATAGEPRAALQAAEETELATFLDAPEGGVLRCQCLLLAAFEGARRRLDTARVAELAYLAFEHACEALDALAARGIRLADHVVQATEERVKRTIRSADAFRATLTARDLEAMRASRLVSLR